MAPEKKHRINRLIIINGKWNTLHTGEVIPTLIIGSPDAKAKYYDKFLNDVTKACNRLDRVVESKSVDRILRLNFVIYDFTEKETAQLEAEIMEKITSLLPKVDKCLYFTHSSDRESLTPPAAATMPDHYSQVVFCEYGGGKGIIYAGEGGILGGALYANIEPGPARWNREEMCFGIDLHRFNKVWNTYYFQLRNRIIELRRQFLTAQAYGENDWKDTDLRKRIREDLQGFEEFIFSKILPEDLTPGQSPNQSIFGLIKDQLPKVITAFESISTDPNSNKDSWETINKYINIWTKETN